MRVQPIFGVLSYLGRYRCCHYSLVSRSSQLSVSAQQRFGTRGRKKGRFQHFGAVNPRIQVVREHVVVMMQVCWWAALYVATPPPQLVEQVELGSEAGSKCNKWVGPAWSPHGNPIIPLKLKENNEPNQLRGHFQVISLLVDRGSIPFVWGICPIIGQVPGIFGLW